MIDSRELQIWSGLRLIKAAIVGDTVAQWLVHWTLGKEVWVWDFQPGHCVVFLGKTINFPSLSCYPRALMGTSKMSGKS